MSYADFIESKRMTVEPCGFDVFDCQLPTTALFPFQRAIVKWALRRGRAAILALGEWFKRFKRNEEHPATCPTLEQAGWCWSVADMVLAADPLARAPAGAPEAVRDWVNDAKDPKEAPHAG